MALSITGGAGLVATACTSGTAQNRSTTAGVRSPAAGAITHVHAIARDRASGDVLLATHQGLLARRDGGWVASGPIIDLMGFTIAPDGTYLASGHAGVEVDLPQPVGLIASSDRGRTWSVLSRGGESDFHALATGPQHTLGFDGTLRLTRDWRHWSEIDIPHSPHDLAMSPTTGAVLATTEEGLLLTTNAGQTWSTLEPPELVALTDWADERTIVAASVSGLLVTSHDAGSTWSQGSARLADIQALSASRRDDGTLEVLVASGTSVLVSTDQGKTVHPLA